MYSRKKTLPFQCFVQNSTGTFAAPFYPVFSPASYAHILEHEHRSSYFQNINRQDPYLPPESVSQDKNRLQIKEEPMKSCFHFFSALTIND